MRMKKQTYISGLGKLSIITVAVDMDSIDLISDHHLPTSGQLYVTSHSIKELYISILTLMLEYVSINY